MTDFDIIVCGATGYTGQRVCEHLAQSYGSDLRWAMAGRDMAKLEDVRARFAVPSHVELIEVDITDPAAATSLARRAKTLISTAGPFATVGEPLVAACAQSGTDYVDISGDAVWIRKMLDRYRMRPIASGARLIFTCGFDSVPSDLGVFLLQEAAREKFGAPATRIKGRIRRLVGGLSGGTLASGRASIERRAPIRRSRSFSQTRSRSCPVLTARRSLPRRKRHSMRTSRAGWRRSFWPA